MKESKVQARIIIILTKTLPIVDRIDEDEAVGVVVLHDEAGVVVRLNLHQTELSHDVVHIHS